MIRCEGLAYDYPNGTRALDGVDLEITAGERVAVVGRNGSGKSTLVRHFNGLLRPTSGRILVGGADAAGRRVAELARVVGLVFDDPGHQIFAGRVRDEVAFGPRNVGLRGGGLELAVSAALAAVGLTDAAAENPYDLGPARRRLLAIASIVAMDTPVVVLDEPTTGLDAAEVARVREIVGALAADGRAVIAISHDLRFVAETFERVVVLGEGRLLLDGAPADVFAEASWPALASTGLEPPLAARLGARLGLGSTPTERSLVAALAAATSGG